MITQCSDPRRSLFLLDKPPGLASRCCVLQSPFIFGLYSTDPASPALSADVSQGLILDPSLKLLSVVASLSPALLTASHLKLASLCSHQKGHPSVVTQRSPWGGGVLPHCSQSQCFPSSHIPPLTPVTGLLDRLLSPLIMVFCPPPHLHLPKHPSVLDSDFLGVHLLPGQTVRSRDS